MRVGAGSASDRSRSRWGEAALRRSPLAIRTMSHPVGTHPLVRNHSRNMRLIRFRTTAFPTFLVTVRPSLPARAGAVRFRAIARTWRRGLSSRSLERRGSRHAVAAASLGDPRGARSRRYFFADVTEIRLRPFARRRRRTSATTTGLLAGAEAVRALTILLCG